VFAQYPAFLSLFLTAIFSSVSLFSEFARSKEITIILPMPTGYERACFARCSVPLGLQIQMVTVFWMTLQTVMETVLTTQ